MATTRTITSKMTQRGRSAHEWLVYWLDAISPVVDPLSYALSAIPRL